MNRQRHKQMGRRANRLLIGVSSRRVRSVMFSPIPLKADVIHLSVNAIFTFIEKQVSPTLEAICTDSIPS